MSSVPHVAPINSPQSMAEMRERPQFLAPLDPKLHTLVEVLTGYSFNQRVPCGLSTCQQGHNTGLLVRTASGNETNLGHVCGKKHFGEAFIAAHTQYTRSVARQDALKRLSSLKAERAAVLAKVQDLISGEFGIRWIFALKNELKNSLGVDTFNHFCLRARRGDYQIVRVKELRGIELERAMETTGKRREEARLVHEVIGQLAPMKWLVWDFRAELIDAVSEPFKALETVEATTMETRELAKHLKIFSGWENRVAEAESLLLQAKGIFNEENLASMRLAASERSGKGEPLIIGKQGQLLSHQGKPSSNLYGWEKTAAYKTLQAGHAPAH